MIAQIISITTGALNFKMAALRFIGITEEVMNVKKKTEFRRAQKLLLCLEWHFFNRRIRSFCWFNWMNPSDSNGSWLYTSIRVIKTIKTEFFNIKTNIYNRIRKHLGNCTKKNYSSKARWILLNMLWISRKIFTSPSANNLLNDFKAW